MSKGRLFLRHKMMTSLHAGFSISPLFGGTLTKKMHENEECCIKIDPRIVYLSAFKCQARFQKSFSSAENLTL